ENPEEAARALRVVTEALGRSWGDFQGPGSGEPPQEQRDLLSAFTALAPRVSPGEAEAASRRLEELAEKTNDPYALAVLGEASEALRANLSPDRAARLARRVARRGPPGAGRTVNFEALRRVAPVLGGRAGRLPEDEAGELTTALASRIAKPHAGLGFYGSDTLNPALVSLAGKVPPAEARKLAGEFAARAANPEPHPLDGDAMAQDGSTTSAEDMHLLALRDPLVALAGRGGGGGGAGAAPRPGGRGAPGRRDPPRAGG